MTPLASALKQKIQHLKSLLALILFLTCTTAFAESTCIGIGKYCREFRSSSTGAPAFPTTSSVISINPSAVPVEKSLGLEMIYFKTSPDVALVTGTGRVGAALSPTSGEETFFGHPSFEDPADYLQRQIEKKKFESQKTILATAANLWNNEERGLKKLSVNVGVQARYNKFTKDIRPGGGVSGVVGPFTFGYAKAQDQFAISYDDWIEPYEYYTESFSGGIYLNSLAIDYSNLRVDADGLEPFTIQLYTASLFLKRWIFTVSQRVEESERFDYDPELQTLVYSPEKRDTFAGVQFAAHKKVLVGLFYNYYLLQDVSVGLTVFFF